MRAIVLYAYPPEPDGISIQGHLLYQGLLDAEHEAVPCNPAGGLQKEFYYRYFKPHVAYGIGFWGNVPSVVRDPLKFGIIPVPWFNADGWVANYHKDLENLNLVLTTSEWVKETYKRDGVDVNNFVPMHIGIETEHFKPIQNDRTEKIRDVLGIKKNEKMILTVGGDVTSKGAQEMFKALAQIDKEFKNWKYVCKSWPSSCARNWSKEERKLIKELGIKKKVISITGSFAREFMPYLLNAADIYAAPSRLEGCGMIQIEAMSCGKPVISINKMGPSETIVHGKTGFLARVSEEVVLNEEWVYPWMGFPKKQVLQFSEPKVFGYRADVDDLAEFSLKLLSDDELREKIGQQAREHAVKNFDYRYIAKKIADITVEKLGIEVSVAQKKV